MAHGVVLQFGKEVFIAEHPQPHCQSLACRRSVFEVFDVEGEDAGYQVVEEEFDDLCICVWEAESALSSFRPFAVECFVEPFRGVY